MTDDRPNTRDWMNQVEQQLADHDATLSDLGTKYNALVQAHQQLVTAHAVLAAKSETLGTQQMCPKCGARRIGSKCKNCGAVRG